MNTAYLTDLAELAFAGYGHFPSNGSPPADDLVNLNGDVHGFSQLQALRFAARFNVALPTFSDATSPNGSGATSFDVTVFKGMLDANSGRIFISFRGTGQKSALETPNDLQSIVENLTAGAAVSQIVAMYNWWQRSPLSMQGAFGED